LVTYGGKYGYIWVYMGIYGGKYGYIWVYMGIYEAVQDQSQKVVPTR